MSENKTAKLSREVETLLSFVSHVEKGWIIGKDNTSGGAKLEAVADMIRSVLSGMEPKVALGIPSGNTMRAFRNIERDKRLARAVYEIRHSGRDDIATDSDAVHEVVKRWRPDDRDGKCAATIEKAYYKHKKYVEFCIRLASSQHP